MRPVEMLLLVANSLAYLVTAVPRLRRARGVRYSALAALPVATAQALVESPRWQMIPSYLLSGAFFLVCLLRGSQSAGETREHSLAGRLALFLRTGLGLAVSAVPPILLPVFRLPRPTGPYAIGTLTYHWVDTARSEVFTPDPNDHREVMVQIWYPAKGNPSSPRAPYVPDGGALAPLARLLGLPGFSFNHFKYVTTNAILSAPVADGEPNYPELIFLHGRGGFRQHNTVLVENLVSHGYIVAAIDMPYAAAGVVFPDGHLVSLDPRMMEDAFKPGSREITTPLIGYLAQDAIFTLDQLVTLNQADPNGILTGRLDLQRTGLIGVSLGAVIGGEASLLEPRLRATLLMDAWMSGDVVQAGLKQPTLLISRDAEMMQREGWSQAEIDRTQTTMRAVFERRPRDSYFVRVPGMFHPDFSDIQLWFWPPFARKLGLIGPIKGERAQRILNDFSLAFFDRHLKGLPAPLLDDPLEQYPEVLYEARHPNPAE
ncbi:MAG: carboxylic ester hydrolase [Anaerolineae bacterium]|nr:carboxylic ester hydrolase [Anaerolineae bacterium]